MLNEELVGRTPNKIGKIIDQEGVDVNFQISLTGGSVNMSSGITQNFGFYVAVAETAGILKVKLVNSDEFINMPFFIGWNPIKIKEISPDDATAVGVYWGI